MKSAFSTLCTLLFLFLFFSSPGYSETLHVPSQYSTIQEAVDAAGEWDDVLVAAGTYYENIYIYKKTLELESESGPESTCIDGSQGSGPVLDIKKSVVTIEGFTISNATSCGIRCLNDSTKIQHNIIENNKDGGILCSGESMIIRNNTISNNTTPSLGGGIECYYCDSSSAAIDMNTFSNNQASWGGAIYCHSASPLIGENRFTGNMASSMGGAIALHHSESIIRNNVFDGNESIIGGGALYCKKSSAPKIINNTLYGNKATLYGGGLFCHDYSSPVILNSIFWNNSARSGNEIYISWHGISTVAINFSNVERGENSIFIEPGGSAIAWGSHMIDDDPGFVDGPNHDFHLLHTSPCVDAGTKHYTYFYSKDMEGDARGSNQTAADIGADEFHSHLYFAGHATPGGEVEARIVGDPGTPVHALFIGTAAADPPVYTKYGMLFIEEPYLVLGPLGDIPLDGVMRLKARIPQSPAAPYDLFMQALMESTHLNHSLTNLEILKIR